MEACAVCGAADPQYLSTDDPRVVRFAPPVPVCSVRCEEQYLGTHGCHRSATEPGGGTETSPLTTLSVGARVKARWHSSRSLFFGEVSKLNDDGTVAVRFDDGDVDLRVPRKDVIVAAPAEPGLGAKGVPKLGGRPRSSGRGTKRARPDAGGVAGRAVHGGKGEHVCKTCRKAFGQEALRRTLPL